MRVLILSANTGGGHNTAAYAIQEECNRRGIEADVEDCLRFLSEKTSEFISWGHSYVYKHLPRVFGYAYRKKEQHSPQFIRESIALGAPKYHAFLSKRSYDAVVCVHVFSGMLVAEEQRRYGKSMPHYFVATDYTCSPGAGEVEADYWLIPDEGLVDEFVRGGAPREQVIPTGIPINNSFSQQIDKTEARQRLGLPIEGRNVLLCCGSIGCGKVDRIVPLFAAKLPEDTTLVVICGNNEKLYEELTSQAISNVKVIGFTQEVAYYMAAADLCLGKPGGLYTTELIASCLPAVLVLLVPGCESRNLEFVTSNGLACGVEDWDAAMEQALDLLADEERRRVIRSKLSDRHAGQGAEYIVDILQKNVNF